MRKEFVYEDYISALRALWHWRSKGWDDSFMVRNIHPITGSCLYEVVAIRDKKKVYNLFGEVVLCLK